MTSVNTFKTFLLLGLLTALLVFGGQAIAGKNGLYMGLVMAVVMNFASYFFSEKIALSMYKAQRVSPGEHPQLYRRLGPMMQRLCHRMGIPEPKLWVIPERSPNAFATGRNPGHSSVAFTAGLLELMDDNQVEAVFAHELAHIKHRDILTSSIAATIGAAITNLAYFAMFFGGRRDDDEGGNPMAAMMLFFLGPIAAMVIQMAVSRTREYAADEAAAKATGTPHGMISALERLESYSRRIPMEASQATAHMFIIKPFGGGGALSKLFSTHPSTEDRVARLMALR